MSATVTTPDGVDSLDVPVSEGEFRDLLKEVADAQEFEVNFKPDGLSAPDGSLWISTYGIENTFIDDEVKQREAAELRRVYEALDAETFDVPDDERDALAFGVEIPTPRDEEWEAFKDAVETAADRTRPHLGVTVIDRYESVKVGCNYGYETPGRTVEEALERVADDLRGRADADVGEPTLELGHGSLRVERVE